MVRGGLTATILITAMAAAPTHAAAASFCTWQPDVLPVPAGVGDAGLEAADGNDWAAGWLGLDGAGPFDPAPVGRWHGAEVESLGLPLGDYTEVHGINSAGVVVGAATDENNRMRGVRYADGAWETLTSHGITARAFDVNSRGDAVGYDMNPVIGDHWENVVVWPADGPPRYLYTTFDGYLLGEPRIDDDGTVVAQYGRTEGITSRSHSFVWAPGTQTPRQLASYRPGDGAAVTDIRNGRIVGENYAADGTTTGVEWNLAGKITRTFPGRPRAVSPTGWVAGLAEPSGKAAVWNGGSRGAALPGPAGHPSAFPNAFGGERVAGHAFGPSTGTVPVVWHRSC